MNESLEDDYENHVDVLIELITQFATVSDNSIYQSVFNTVVSKLKQEESPESNEMVSNGWEQRRLGCIFSQPNIFPHCLIMY
jgi:DNA-binding transcriptional regulator YbjK